MSDTMKKERLIDTFVEEGYEQELATLIVTNLEQTHAPRTIAIKDMVANKQSVDLVASLANMAALDNSKHLMTMSMNVAESLAEFGEQIDKVMTGIIIAETISIYYNLKPFTQEDRDATLEEMLVGLASTMTPDID